MVGVRLWAVAALCLGVNRYQYSMLLYRNICFAHLCCVIQVWSKLLSPVSEFLPRSINMFMAVPTVYAKLIDNYDERMRSDSSHSRDYIKMTCSSKIRYLSYLYIDISRPKSFVVHNKAATSH